MSRKSSPKDAELYKRIDEVIFYLWDPVEVSNAVGARSEYEGYLPSVFEIVRRNAPSSEIADYLMRVESERMGMKPRSKKASEIAELLIEYKEWIDDTLSN